jgi:hypothetical protein
MVRSVILDQQGFPGKISSGDVFQISQVGLSVKDLCHLIKESGSENLHRAKDLQALSLAGDRNAGLVSRS